MDKDNLISVVARGMLKADKDATAEMLEMQKQVQVLYECKREVFRWRGRVALASLPGLPGMQALLSRAYDEQHRYLLLSREEKGRRKDEFKPRFKELGLKLSEMAEQLELSQEKVGQIRGDVEKKLGKSFTKHLDMRVKQLTAELQDARKRGDEQGMRDSWLALESQDMGESDQVLTVLRDQVQVEVEKRVISKPTGHSWQVGGVERLPAQGLLRVLGGHEAIEMGIGAEDVALQRETSSVTVKLGRQDVSLSVSPVHRVTVDAPTRAQLLIPAAATHFCFSFPAAEADLKSLSRASGKRAPCVMIWLITGGFVYLDDADRTVAVNTFDNKSVVRTISFMGPFQLKPEAYEGLRKDGRMRPVTMKDLLAKGAKSFCWVFPSEALTGSTVEERKQWAHGAFTYHYDADAAKDNIFSVVNYGNLAPQGTAQPPAGNGGASDDNFVTVQVPSVEGSEGRGPSLRLNKGVVRFKCFVCAVLFALVVVMCVVAYRQHEWRDDAAFCDADAPDFCGLKWSVLGISLMLLSPEVAAMGGQVRILLSKDDGEQRGQISKGSFLKNAGKFLKNACNGLIALLLPLVALALWACRYSQGTRTERGYLSLVIALWFEALLTWSLFPLAYLVLASSTKVSDLVVNLCAVQFMAKVDDEIVKLVFHLDKTVQEEANELFYSVD
jgi:hypothetical protein